MSNIEYSESEIMYSIQKAPKVWYDKVVEYANTIKKLCRLLDEAKDKIQQRDLLIAELQGKINDNKK